MPRVPEAGFAGDSTRPLGAPYLRQPAQGGADAVARGLGDVASLAAGIEERHRRRADGAVLEAARNDLLRFETSLLYEGDDPALKRENLHAIGVADEFGARYQERGRQVLAKLKPRQQAEFKAWLDQSAVRFDHSLRSYEAKQVERGDELVHREGLSRLQEKAARSYADPRERRLTMGEGEASIRAFAEDRDAPADEAVAEWRSAVHLAGISQLIDEGRATAASEIYAEHRDEILSKDRARVEAALRPARDKERAILAADQIAGELEPGYTAEQRADAIRAAEQQPAELRDEVTSRVLRRLALLDGTRGQQIEEAYARAHEAISSTGSVDAASASDLRILPADQRERLEQLAVRVTMRTTGKPMPSDMVSAFDWWGRLSAKERAEADLQQLTPFLEETDLRWFAKEQVEIRRELERGHPASPTMTFTQAFDAAVQSIPEADRPSEDQIARLKQRAAVEFWSAREANGGKDLTDPEAQDLLGKLLLPVYQRTSGFGLLALLPVSGLRFFGRVEPAGPFGLLDDPGADGLFIPIEEIEPERAATIRGLLKSRGGAPVKDGDVERAAYRLEAGLDPELEAQLASIEGDAAVADERAGDALVRDAEGVLDPAQYAAIPEEVRRGIVDSFAARDQTAPSEAAIQEVYRMIRARDRKARLAAAMAEGKSGDEARRAAGLPVSPLALQRSTAGSLLDAEPIGEGDGEP